MNARAIILPFLTTFFLISILTASLPSVHARGGSIAALSVVEETNRGEVAELSLEIKPGSGATYIESSPLTRLDTQMSARLARDAACRRSTVDCSRYDFFYTIHVRSSIIGGPSAGGALAVLTYAVLEDLPIRNDTAMTGSILSGDIIGPVGGVAAKVRGAQQAGYARVAVPKWEPITETESPRVQLVATALPSGQNQTTDTNRETADEQINQTQSTIDTTKNTDATQEEYPSKYGIPFGASGEEQQISSWQAEGITVIPIATLDDAIEALTGHRPQAAPAFPAPSASYEAGMERVAQTLCQRAVVLRSVVDRLPNITKNMTADADRQYARAMNASARGDSYSAASLCFSAGLQNQELTLRTADKNSKETVLSGVRRNANAIREAIEKADIQTISDLEVAMIASERLADVEHELTTINQSDPSPEQLAYASERLETARAWLTLLGRVDGAPLTIDKDELFIRCRTKLDEAQERVNYVSLVYPQAGIELQTSMREALAAAQRESSALCILQASQAKAEANAILSAIYIPEDAFGAVLETKRAAARDAIARANEQGTFPILAYSYVEYADELAPRDQVTAALYAEYSLELASLPIYFPREHSWIRVDTHGLAIFGVGAGMGALLGILFMHGVHRKHQARKAPRKR